MFSLFAISFTDCSTLVLMKRHGIKNIATFDSGFRKVKWLKVV
ncbi:type II toxin-antitoxin system VapC family toxin [Candidatus Micrarchaeota archaeon]|nr:type II toxin-antitoxin system VapC family toxin [Candidatus Micrarchaeota archaeon]